MILGDLKRSDKYLRYRGLQLLWYTKGQVILSFSARSMTKGEMKHGALDPHHRELQHAPFIGKSPI